MSQHCLKCDFESTQQFEECPRCGVYQSKFRDAMAAEPPHRRPSARRSARRSRPPPGHRRRELAAGARSALLAGTTAALILYVIPFTRFVFSYLLILVHELGHAATSWLFAYPAIPSFDFLYGGGVTVHWQRSTLLLAVAYSLWGATIFLCRRRSRLLIALLLGVAAYTAAVLTPLEDLLIITMGHGSELVFATIFLYRAMSRESLHSEAERPAYSFAGAFITLGSILFAYQLVTSAIFQREYEQAKGGGHWMDFSRIADDYLGLDLTVVAAIFFVAALLPPVVAYLWHLNREPLWDALVWLCEPREEVLRAYRPTGRPAPGSGTKSGRRRGPTDRWRLAACPRVGAD